MTADARQQAERVVDAVLHEDRRDGATGDFAVRRRAIDALAAAIEWYHATHQAMERDEDYGDSMTGTEIGLLQALSALDVEVER